MPATPVQKALFVSAPGEPFVLGELPIPAPGPHDVLVKIESAALNPVDWKVFTENTRLITRYPFVGGTDGAGFVEAVGSEVKTLGKGDRVVLHGWFDIPNATFQQYCITPAKFTAKIPDNVSFDEAASIPLTLMTVMVGMYSTDPRASNMSVGLTPFWNPAVSSVLAGKPAFVIGGSSSVGQYAIQIAKLAGSSPIITTAAPHHAEHLRSIGATHVLDRALPPAGILSSLSELLAGRPLEFAYDAISDPDTQTTAYTALAPGGKLVITNNEAITAELKAKGETEGKVVRRTVASAHLPANNVCGEEAFKRLTGWLASGEFKPNRVEVLPDGLLGIPAGLERLKANKVGAVKLIGRPQETP